MFSIIGHDLRGPIGGLQSLLGLFETNEIPISEFKKFLPKLKTDVDHILFTLNNLLSWGQTQLKNTTTKPTIINLKSCLKDSIQLHNENASKKRIRLINDISDNSFVWADKNHVDIIFRNLISNAIKFTKETGQILIKAESKEDHWVISVADTGVGMPENIRIQLFKDDEKITTYGTNNEKGTGLGLSLCKEMVEKNKGEIWVDSQLNKGTTFTFTLPKAKSQQLKQAS